MSDLNRRVWFGTLPVDLHFTMRRLIPLTVTGASTGLGRAVVEVALEKGNIVVATARRPDSLDDLALRYPKEYLLILPLDVTQPENVVEAFAQATRSFGRIDVVFNNAGIGHLGELEGMEESRARSILETNFWGAVSVTKEAMKCFRETNPSGAGGRLIQMSSYSGIIGLPGMSFYGASKFGSSSPRLGEGFRVCSRHSCLCMQPWKERLKHWPQRLTQRGISRCVSASVRGPRAHHLFTSLQVTIIEPGWIRTEVVPKAIWSPEHPAYQNPDLLASQIRRVGLENTVTWKDAKRSAEAFYKIACVPDPPLHFVVGKDAIAGARKKIAALAADIDAYEELSEGLEE